MIPSHLYEDFPSKVNTLLSLPCICPRVSATYTARLLFWYAGSAFNSTSSCRNGLNNAVIMQGIMGTCTGRTLREWDWLYEGSFTLKWGSSSAGKDEKRPCTWWTVLIHSSNRAKMLGTRWWITVFPKPTKQLQRFGSVVINLLILGLGCCLVWCWQRQR